jgi:hypothetical protein
MIVSVKEVTLDDPELAGTYEVRRLEGGRLLLEPRLTGIDEIERRHGLEPASVEALEREQGALLPADDEG